MDGPRFDDFARTFVLSRRKALKALLQGAATGVAAVLLPEMAGAAQECTSLHRRCATDAECCSGACDESSGACACGDGTEECGRDCISAEQFQIDANNCGSCGNRCQSAPECQIPACLDGICGGVPDESSIGQSCGRSGETCGADGVCACPPDRPTSCRTDCTDTSSDISNCGACDHQCRAAANSTAVCTGGVCGLSCDGGFSSCGAGCCANGQDCCNDVCCRPSECCAAEGCVPCRCIIGNRSFDQGEINPANACQFCDPTRNRSDWTTAQDDSFCGEGRTCCNGDCCSPTECCDGVHCSVDACTDQCEIEGQPFESGQHNPANGCQICDPQRDRFHWMVIADQTACGGVPGRVCCNGECCSPTECCGAVSCQECGSHCRIGNEDIDEGTPNPANPCEACRPEIGASDWSPADDDTVCGDGAVCCSGDCCSRGQCCNGGVCGTCQCHIGLGVFDPGERNPLNHCEICDPLRNKEGWSFSQNNSDCGLTGGRNCCGGICCPEGECCNSAGECERCGCVISGDPVAADIANPANTCQVCDPDENRFDWTLLGDGDACGNDSDDRECCDGSCCPQGQCCEKGSCQDCGCDIGGKPIDRGTVNDANVCEVCDPTRSRFTWSPVLGEKACGDGGSCCGGDCCPSDQCCLIDACGECLCSIGNENVPPETPNPDNACEACKPDADPFGWTPLADSAPCADLPGQVCCGGHCCEPGECCTPTGCGECGCTIDGQFFADGEVNPDNECEVCNRAVSATDWSPAPESTSCALGEGTCCGKDCCFAQCCPGGICCAGIATCGECGSDACTIEGATFPEGAVNPQNSCQSCNPFISTVSWTFRSDFDLCGAEGKQFCCNGVCCDQGACCNDNSVCEIAGNSRCAKQCLIDGQSFPHTFINPANPCQECSIFLSTTAWSPRLNIFPCGDGDEQTCCNGVCCAPGVCCSSSFSGGSCVPCP